jgi:hypothetical protein
MYNITKPKATNDIVSPSCERQPWVLFPGHADHVKEKIARNLSITINI